MRFNSNPVPRPVNRRAALGLACAVALALTGCGDGGDAAASPTGAAGTGAASAGAGSAEPIIYYIVKAGTAPYFVSEAQGAVDEAKKQGAKLTVVDVKGDANATLSAVDTAVANKAAGILMIAPDQKLGPNLLRKAKDAGIPLIALNDGLKDDGGADAPFIGFEATALGAQMGKAVADLYAQAGKDPSVKVASLEQPKLSVCNERTDSAKEAFLAATPGFDTKNIVSVPYEDSLDSGLNAMSPVVTANPGVKTWLLWGCNDDGVYGAVKALQNSGVDKAGIFGVGLGGAYACDALVKSGESGFRGTIYIDSAKHGEAGVQEILAFRKGGTPVPPRTTFPGVVVNRDNAKEVAGC